MEEIDKTFNDMDQAELRRQKIDVFGKKNNQEKPLNFNYRLYAKSKYMLPFKKGLKKNIDAAQHPPPDTTKTHIIQSRDGIETAVSALDLLTSPTPATELAQAKQVLESQYNEPGLSMHLNIQATNTMTE